MPKSKLIISKLGSFNLSSIRVYPGQETTVVQVWTDAPINSPSAAEWLNGLHLGHEGMAEIKTVLVFNDQIHIEMEVNTEAEGKEVYQRFMLALVEVAADLDDMDLKLFRDRAMTLNPLAAMAYDLDGGTGERGGLGSHY